MAESKMTVVYALLASAVALLGMAAAFWYGTIDLGDQTTPMAALLVVGAVMDLAVAALFLRRISR